MPDLNIDKFVLFLFIVTPGFVAIQVYSLKCPPVKRDWGTSLTEILAYSTINFAIWHWWVMRMVRTPYDQINGWQFTAALAVICLASPSGMALLWYELRTGVLHRWCKMDHPMPKAWDYFVRKHDEYWVLFHLKNGKMLGGYFSKHSYAATFPHEPEIYVEEIYRVDDRGVFVEEVEDTLGGVIRISECERVEFLRVKPEVVSSGPETTKAVAGAGENTDGEKGDRGPTGQDQCRPDGNAIPAERPEAATGRVGDGIADQPVQAVGVENGKEEQPPAR